MIGHKDTLDYLDFTAHPKEALYIQHVKHSQRVSRDSLNSFNHISVTACAHARAQEQMPMEVRRGHQIYSSLSYRGISEPPDVGTGNLTQALWEGSNCS